MCPEGEEFKKLSEIAVYEKKRISVDHLTEQTYVGVENLLPDKQGKTRASNLPKSGNFIRFKKDDILIGNIRPYLKKIWLAEYDGETNGDVLPICITSEEITPRFLYYCLSSDQFFLYDMQYAKGAKMPRGNKDAVMEYKIPVPPLPIQAEIVRILDALTDLTVRLTAELTAELTARKKQYEYYRDYLLDFSKLGGVIQRIKLGDIGRVLMCKRILKSETSPTGDVPFYKIGTFGQTADAYISREKYQEYKDKYPYPQKGSVLLSAAGSIGKMVIFDGEPAYFQDSNIVWLENDESKILNKFLFYWYQTKPWKTAQGGTIERLYNDLILQTEIPLYSLETQQRIVDVLDNFDAVCNSLQIGLPAEIDARKKQYEYYRDLILNFYNMKEGRKEGRKLPSTINARRR